MPAMSMATRMSTKARSIANVTAELVRGSGGCLGTGIRCRGGTRGSGRQACELGGAGGRSDRHTRVGLGLAMGFGGLLGSYTGAHLLRRLPERVIRRALGLLSILIAIRYLLEGVGL